MEFKRMLKRIMGVILLVSIISESMLNTYAAYDNNVENDIGEEEVESFELGDTRIDYYETHSGDKVFLQYVDGVLTQKNTLPDGQKDIIVREFFGDYDEARERKNATDVIHPSDYLIIEEGEETEEPILERTKTMGTINYRAIGENGLVYYGMRCSYTKSSTNSTYTIRSYIGTLVDLVSILVSATNLLAKIGTSFIKRVCISAGITIAGGKLKSALSTTVACKRTKFNWKLVDTQDSKHYTTYIGYRYDVTDSAYNTGKIYFEGMCPKQWGKQEMAILFHDKLFGYTSYSVVGWN